MSDYLQIQDFLEPLNTVLLTHDEGFHDGQLGKSVILFEEDFPDIDKAEIVLVGCNETRGTGNTDLSISSADMIRSELYSMYNWHTELYLADIGNIKTGATLIDTYAALKTVVNELLEEKKVVIILGGSHDLTLAQYDAYRDMNKIIEATGIDAFIDLNMESPRRSKNFLMEMLTGDPNYIRHYNHIGFQSYFVHPKMLETMDKLRFDCFRLGKVKENIEDMEPVLRNTHLLSIDISSIAHAYAPSNRESLNGFSGEEICRLTQYAGLSGNLTSLGIYGYNSGYDIDSLSAKQVAQMIWYFMDGKSRSKLEVSLENKNAFNEFHTVFAEIGTIFLQSKKTGRWWMQLPNKNFIACSYADYVTASNNEIPERWLRAQERD